MSDLPLLLNKYDSPIIELTEALRDLVVTHCKDCEEKVQLGWGLVTYKSDTVFCAIAPHKRWVNLQFHQGVNLPDPQNRLEGTGKAMRHIKIRTPADVDDAVVSLILAALAFSDNA